MTSATRPPRPGRPRRPEREGLGGDVVELPGVPGLGRMYRRGVVGSVLHGGGGRTGRADALPTHRLLVRGVQADVDRLTAYQHLLGEPGTDVLPAGFVHVLTFPTALALMTGRDFPLPLLGMVHLANRVTQHRPVLLGEALDVVVHAENLATRRAGVSVDVVTRVLVGGDVVWDGVSTYLVKGARRAGAAGGGPADDSGQSSTARPVWTPPDPTARWRLGTDVGRAYATVSGDRNPIHTSALAARAFGFRRPIAHGMYTAARALADVGAARGEAFDWSVEFLRPVLLPGTVSVRVAPDDDGGFTVAGWDARTGRRHLDVTVRPG